MLVHECGRDRLASVGVRDRTLISQVEALQLFFFLDTCIFVVINEKKVDSCRSVQVKPVNFGLIDQYNSYISFLS